MLILSKRFTAAAVCCILSMPIAFSQILKYQSSLSAVLQSNPPKSTVGNINVLNQSDGTSIEIAYLPYLIQFTCGDGVPQNGLGFYDGVASISLAMEHLNTGNGSIIPEVSGLNQQCPLKFATSSFDTECQQLVAVDHVISLTDRGMEQQLFPSAILGAYYSSISMPTSLISGLRDIPQISPGSTSSALDNKGQYKLFGRTIPNDDGTAIPLIAKLNSWSVNHLAVLYVDDSYGNAFMEGLVLAARQDAPNLQIHTVNLIANPDGETIRSAISKLAATKYTYFFGILFSTYIDDIMTEAYDQGIAGTGRHNWIFSDGLVGYLDGLQFEAGSKLALAYRGIGVVTATGGIAGMTNYDKLDTSMQQLKNEADLSYIESLFPTDYSDGKDVNHSVVSRNEAFMSTPTFATPFLYDAVIALGLASCQLRLRGNAGFTGADLFQAFKNTTFEGTSGSVIFDPVTGTRDPNSAVFLLKNAVYNEDTTVEPGMIQFKSVDTDVFNSGQWENLMPYTFNDGTSTTSPDLPPLEADYNYPSVGLKVVGILFFLIIFVLAIGFSCWTYIYRAKHVLRSSQPLFLYIISAGTLLMGSSLIPLSIDLSITNQDGADAACMSIPWLLAIGFSLTFSALFTKTYRVNQIMKNAASFKRVKITPVDVMKPMIVLLLLNVIVLTVWTVVDPLSRKTVVVRQDEFSRDSETYGNCTSDHQLVFLGMLGFINAGSLLFALWQAYQARKVSTDLQESSYIFIAMALILMVSFVGIPVIIIAEENRDAYYFLSAAVIFTICSSLLVLIYVPKYMAFKEHKPRRQAGVRDLRNSTPLSSHDEEGINILWSPNHQADLEEENKKLLKEIDQMKKMLKKEVGHTTSGLSSSAEEGSTHRKTISFKGRISSIANYSPRRSSSLSGGSIEINVVGNGQNCDSDEFLEHHNGVIEE